MHRIALTGATGFIGSHLTGHLLNSDLCVNALVRDKQIAFQPTNSSLNWIIGDLHTPASIERLIAGVDCVIHCAGVVRGITREEFCRVNEEGTRLLAEACLKQNTPPRFILISSLAAREPSLSNYAYSKRMGEKALEDLYGKRSWAALRPPAVYGPGDRELMPLFRSMARGICPVVGSGNQRISLINVQDLSKAACAAAISSEACGIYELHDGKPGGYSWHDIIEAVSHVSGNNRAVKIKIPVSIVKIIGLINICISKITGSPPMLTPGKVNELVHPDWTADNSKITKATGWKPSTGLKEGLQEILMALTP